MWERGAWKYARCPRCYRQELTTWSAVYYHPPASVSLKIQLGAKPYRCAACRCNFASFRARRGKFAWRHQTHAEPTTSLHALAESVAAKTESDKSNLAGPPPNRCG
jgi:hypothetical protein